MKWIVNLYNELNKPALINVILSNVSKVHEIGKLKFSVIYC